MKKLSRLAIVVIEPSEKLSNSELKVELTSRLKSEFFAIDRITILDGEEQTMPIFVKQPKTPLD